MNLNQYLTDRSLACGLSQTKGEWARLGLEKIEDYSGNIVAAWAEGFSQAQMKSLMRSESFELVCEAAQFVMLNMPSDMNVEFTKAWKCYMDFISAIRSKGELLNDVIPPMVVNFFAAIIFKSAFDTARGDSVLTNALINVDERRISSEFFENVKIKARSIPLHINPSGAVAEELSKLPDCFVKICSGII